MRQPSVIVMTLLDSLEILTDEELCHIKDEIEDELKIRTIVYLEEGDNGE